MTRLIKRALMISLPVLALTSNAAEAHVKWFLGQSEAEILRHPKPELFTQFSIYNVVPLCLTLLFIYATAMAGKRFSESKMHQSLAAWAERHEPFLNLFMGICVGSLLVYCALTKTLFAPNFIICSHCPWWLAYAECFAGLTILFGGLTRVGATVLLGLLGFTFMKHSLADCLDLVPLYGLAFYFLLAGRGKYSVDALLKVERECSPFVIGLGHLLVRVSAGVGLMILAMDEKLLHPQLALFLINHIPALNCLSFLHIPDAMFVLCAGLTEFLLGVMIVSGSFPRLAVIGLAAVFAATTGLFGVSELLGHLPYYAMIASILLRGGGTVPAAVVINECFSRAVGTSRTSSAVRMA